MTAELLYEVMGGSVSLERYAALLPAVADALTKSDCNTINRVAMWCAQIGHESVGLKYMKEIWGPTPQQRTYQGRMGNTNPGDGARYQGRGPIQITGKDNYRNLSRWAHTQGYVPTESFFVDDPVALESDEYAFLGAIWYWTVARPRINTMCDAGDLLGVTRAINGGTYGLEDRQRRWNRCRAMGNRLLTLTQPEDWSIVWYELTGER